MDVTGRARSIERAKNFINTSLAVDNAQIVLPKSLGRKESIALCEVLVYQFHIVISLLEEPHGSRPQEHYEEDGST